MAFNITSHFDRVQSAVQSKYDPEKVAGWVRKHTRMGGRPFSFKDHEYQIRILQSDAPIKIVRKCSQVGISELAARYSLALLNMIDNFSIIYTFPTVDFGRKFTKSRLDPIIEASRTLSDALQGSDSTELKRFNNSLMYLRGTYGSNQAISVPADLVIHDEYDFSNFEVMSNFQSRLTHSSYKWKFLFSTPTLPDIGISNEFKDTRRFFNQCKCHKCGHWFLPDYMRDVVLPGWDGPLLDITKADLKRFDVKEARLLCPKCGKEPSLQLEHRDWVCENPLDAYTGEGFQVSPFDAPNVIDLSYLIEASTMYKRKDDFVNFNLGLPMESADSSLTQGDVDKMLEAAKTAMPGAAVIGLDMGLTCHMVVAVLDGKDKLNIIHSLTVSYKDVVDKFAEVAREYRVVAAVVDSQPYVETVYRLQGKHPFVYGSVYVTSKDLVPFKLKDKSEDAPSGILDERQVNVNRNRALDALMLDVRSGRVTLADGPNTELMRVQLTDMKRMRPSAASGPLADENESYRWVKSAGGNDHFHHAMLYAWVAARLGVAAALRRPSIIVPWFTGKFKMES